MVIQRAKGTQDILPGAIEKWQSLEETIRSVCQEYGYEEIRTPVFEATELFQRGVGDTTDIVNKEMYTFLDKGKRSLTLRPEGTASVCRAYVENKLYTGALPLKLYYLGPMFRYERPQTGRFRQFHQFGVEVLGGDKPVVDAEVISLVWDFYRRLGLAGLEVHINSVGCPVCRRQHAGELQKFLQECCGQLCRDCQDRFERNPLRVLDCKNPQCQQLTAGAPTTLDLLCPDCSLHFQHLQELLQAAGVIYKINPRLVRGLDYYCKTAFEVLVEEIGAQSAICGGGRYDRLVQEIGGPPTAGIGFAMGMERVLAALEAQQKVPGTGKSGFAMILPLGTEAQRVGFRLASNLRQERIPVSIDLTEKSLKAQLKAADRQGMGFALILGEDELSRGVLIMRNLKSGEQEEISISEAHLCLSRKYREGAGK
jgi:histidyl-tRNA synthetase